nr:hypothetical protein [Mycobacterium riyadhense]
MGRRRRGGRRGLDRRWRRRWAGGAGNGIDGAGGAGGAGGNTTLIGSGGPVVWAAVTAVTAAAAAMPDC